MLGRQNYSPVNGDGYNWLQKLNNFLSSLIWLIDIIADYTDITYALNILILPYSNLCGFRIVTDKIAIIMIIICITNYSLLDPLCNVDWTNQTHFEIIACNVKCQYKDYLLVPQKLV